MTTNTKISKLTMIILSLIITAESLDAVEPKEKGKSFDEIVSVTNSRGWWSGLRYFSGNEWSLNVTNDGSFATTTDQIGGRWPRGSENSVIYSSGLWIGVNNELGDYPRVSGRMYNSDFRPGSWDDPDPNSSENQTKLVNRLLNNTDWEHHHYNSYNQWPVDRGAPWNDANGDGIYNVSDGDRPHMPLDQSIFTIYNDQQPGGGFGGEPIGAEVRQLLYGGVDGNDQPADADGSFEQVFFVDYEIVNKSDQTWYSPRFGIFMDPDIGPEWSNDLVGTLENENMVYAYNGEENEDGFEIPPAVGVKVLGTKPGDFGGEHNLSVYAGGALCSSCLGDGLDTWDPDNDPRAYYRLNGLDNYGVPIINPNTGEQSLWQFDGDPTDGSGWIDNVLQDKRILISIASNDIAPLDTIRFTISVGVAAGWQDAETATSGITNLTSILQQAEEKWNNQFSTVAFVDRPIIERPWAEPFTLDFEAQEIGMSDSKDLHFTNSGNLTANVDLSTANPNLSLDPASVSLEPGGGESVILNYSFNDIAGFESHNVPGDYSTIQDAINSATDTQYDISLDIDHNDSYLTSLDQESSVVYKGGDDIYVDPGTYFEEITINKGINLFGSGADVTILDGNNAHRIIYVDNNGAEFSLIGFTVQNGYFSGDWGTQGTSGGVMIWTSHVDIRDNHFINNKAIAGGALYIYNHSTGLIQRNLFLNNDNLDLYGYGPNGRAVRLNVPGNNQDEELKFYNNTVWTDSDWDYQSNGSASTSIRGSSPQVRVVNNIVVASGTTWGIMRFDNTPLVMFNLTNGGFDGGLDTGNNPNYEEQQPFHDPENSDFTLFASSSAIDGGDPDLDNDGITWENDPDDQDPDGTRLDIGYGHERDPNIAEVRSGELGNTYTVSGIVNSNNRGGANASYTGLSIQDYSAGIDIYINPDINDFDQVFLKPGDEIQVTGVLEDYHSLRTVIVGALDDIQVISERNSLPEYQIITIEEFVNSSEDFESELIRFPLVSIVNTDGWPLNEGESGNVQITDGGYHVPVYIDKDFDIDGNPVPFNPVSFSGLGDQYDIHQLKPQSYKDISLTADPGFEVRDYIGNGWQNRPSHWEYYPQEAPWGSPCMHVVVHGEPVFNSPEYFIPYSGNSSVKMWGLGGNVNDFGSGSENNLYQTFEGEYALPSGTEIVLDAKMMSDIHDWVGQGENYARLFFKYFAYDENQQPVWTSGKWSNPFDGTFEPNTWYGFSLKDTIPENIDITQIGVQYNQINEAGGAVHIDDLTARVDRSLPMFYTQLTNVVHGDTGLVDVMLDGAFPPMSSIELTFSGYHGILDFIEIVADESSLMGQLDWVIVNNNTESLLITASAGAETITQPGKLFSIKLAVNEDLESQLVPIDVVDFLGNEDMDEYMTQSGGLQVVWGPASAFTHGEVVGDYPLTVNFIDESIPGTFPIENWSWNFGNDSMSTIQSPTFTYLFPGEYDVSLMLEDEFGLADTLLYPSLVQIDTVFGDVSWNGTSQAYDASLILKSLVGLYDFSPLQNIIGDVTLDESISALDASYVLQYTVGLINELPYIPDQNVSSGGDFSMEDIFAEPGMIIEIPVNISNAENIKGLSGKFEYDSQYLALDTLGFGNYLDGYMKQTNEINTGEIIFAVSGNNAISENGSVMVLRFEVLNQFNLETNISLVNLRINENEVINLASEMRISYLLGISSNGIPEKFALHQNYPNPFNPETKIRYDLPESNHVNLIIYDIKGREIKSLVNKNQDAGFRIAQWDGTNNTGEIVSAGMYFYVIEAGNKLKTKKMILLK